MNIFGKRSVLPFLRKSDRKEDKSRVSFAHEQNIICSQTHLNDIAYEHSIICRQLFAGHVLGSRPMKRKKIYLSDNHHYFSSVDIKICITKRFTWWKQVRFGWQWERISCALCWSLQWLLLLFFCLKIQVKECSLIRFNQMFIITEILLHFSYTQDSNFEISTSRNSSSAVSVREYWQTLVLGSIRVHDSVCNHVTWRPCWWSIK